MDYYIFIIFVKMIEAHSVHNILLFSFSPQWHILYSHPPIKTLKSFVCQFISLPEISIFSKIVILREKVHFSKEPILNPFFTSHNDSFIMKLWLFLSILAHTWSSSFQPSFKLMTSREAVRRLIVSLNLIKLLEAYRASFCWNKCLLKIHNKSFFRDC